MTRPPVVVNEPTLLWRTPRFTTFRLNAVCERVRHLDAVLSVPKEYMPKLFILSYNFCALMYCTQRALECRASKTMLERKWLTRKHCEREVVIYKEI